MEVETLVANKIYKIYVMEKFNSWNTGRAPILYIVGNIGRFAENLIRNWELFSTKNALLNNASKKQ
jgi:hypothetical protein